MVCARPTRIVYAFPGEVATTFAMEPMKLLLMSLLGALALLMLSANAFAQQWKAADVAISSRWAKDVSPDNAWPEYPRPQLTRNDWTNLNGLWDYKIAPLGTKDAPADWDGKILVPFALESSLSGVGKRLERDQELWYGRTFDAPAHDGRMLLHFEAVDYECEVWINGTSVGTHTGGSLPFSFDITDALTDGENQLVMRVHDFTDDWGKFQLRGKQIRNPHGIWYTPVSGIWQTVWLEPVAKSYVESIKIDTKVDPNTVTVATNIQGDALPNASVRVTMSDDGQEVASSTGIGAVVFNVPDAELWSPDSPKLYDLKVELLDYAGEVVDTVESYVGIREVGQKMGDHGKLVFTLNGEEIFHWGPLDQGWWPDGLLTPPTDEAMRYDVDYLKQAGFNMLRKHIKVENRRFYAYCDEVGMMLYQDQPSGGHGNHGDGEWPHWTRMDRNVAMDVPWPDFAHEQYMVELKNMVDTLYNHPSIVSWVPFNEAWGQHRTMEVGKWIVEYDPSRHINIASGGNFWPVGDIVDHHEYPHPKFPWDDERFAPFIHIVGEFGGHGFPVEGHRWDEDGRNWGYGGLPKDEAEYLDRFAESMRLLRDLKKQGIAGGIYTQTTDVEVEINGLLTYDREVTKIEPDKVKEMTGDLLEN